MEKKNYNPEKALSQAREAYKSETPEIKKLLEDIFGKDNLVNPLEVCERVTSFETACAEIGVDAAAFMEKYKDEPKDVIAYHKLRIIAEALNEGWKPQFKKGEYRWFPWFYLYTKGEIENMTEEEKKQRNLLLLWGGNASRDGCRSRGCELGLRLLECGFEHRGSPCSKNGSVGNLFWSPIY